MELPRHASILPALLLTLYHLLASPPLVEAADVWTGRWNGTVVVTTGAGAGRAVQCEFLISQDGVGFAGMVSCPGFGPVPFSGNAAGGIAGAVEGGGSFGGKRTGRAASGTWSLPARGSFGTWSISRATP